MPFFSGSNPLSFPSPLLKYVTSVARKGTEYKQKLKIISTLSFIFLDNILKNLFGLLKCLIRSWIIKCGPCLIYNNKFTCWLSIYFVTYPIWDIRNKLATELVILKVHNVKLSFDIWLVLYMYFILYFWQCIFNLLV